MLRRQKGSYFKQELNAPEPIRCVVKKCVNFNEADVMAIVWHGNYTKYFEEALGELGRQCGMSYREYYKAKIQAPIVQLHIDYHSPLLLEEKFTVEAAYVWAEGARLNTEYTVLREDGSLAVTGYTIQMFIDAVSHEPLLTTPSILESFRKRWLNGEFKK